MTTKYPCGCQNEIHEPSGVLHSVSKCAKHRAKQRDPATLDQRYYKELGVIKDGMLQQTNHLAELAEALGPFPEPNPYSNDYALEIGCGVSPYVRAIQEAGWYYVGIDSSMWAIEWMASHYGRVQFIGMVDDFETLEIVASHGFILAAHCIEHMHDAPGAIAKCAQMLEPGGELWIVVPDDSDPVNPDHLWYFQPNTLQSCVENTGLIVERLEVRKHVPHENFIYLRARKP